MNTGGVNVLNIYYNTFRTDATGNDLTSHFCWAPARQHFSGKTWRNSFITNFVSTHVSRESVSCRFSHGGHGHTSPSTEWVERVVEKHQTAGQTQSSFQTGTLRPPSPSADNMNWHKALPFLLAVSTQGHHWQTTWPVILEQVSDVPFPVFDS